jgi:hypothetical protein
MSRPRKVFSDDELRMMAIEHFKFGLTIETVAARHNIMRDRVYAGIKTLINDRLRLERIAPEIVSHIMRSHGHNISNSSFHAKTALSDMESEYASVVDWNEHYRNFQFKHKL